MSRRSCPVCCHRATIHGSAMPAPAMTHQRLHGFVGQTVTRFSDGWWECADCGFVATSSEWEALDHAVAAALKDGAGT